MPGAREHLLPEIFDQERVLADQQRRQILLDYRRGDAAADPGFADADDAAIGLDLDDQGAAPRLHPGGAGIGRVARTGQRDRADGGDFHKHLLKMVCITDAGLENGRASFETTAARSPQDEVLS